MKIGIVLEGGAMKGLYTAGVLDAFMEASLRFDGVIGVSAGALFGVNFLSGQKGRVIRYNKRFNRDRNYMGIWPLLKTGNVVDTEYAYERVPRKLDPFDDAAFQKSGVPFYAAITNLRTGKAEYPLIRSVFEQMDVLRASGSMPFVSRPVKIEDEYYLDGAVADSIPVEKMMKMGYEKIVVVLTKPAGYRKKAIPAKLVKAVYGKRWPEFAKTLQNRHEMYNAQMALVEKLEEEGKIQVLRPSKEVKISRTEKDPERMEEMYQLGKADANLWLGKEKGWLINGV